MCHSAYKPNVFSGLLAIATFAVFVPGTLPHAFALPQTQLEPDFRFALVRYQGDWAPRPRGLPRLAWEVRKRTSINAALEVAAADPATDIIFEYPMLVWQGDAAFAPLPEAAIVKLRQHLTMGGTLVVDISDGQPDGGFARSIHRDLGRLFPDQKLRRVPADHVLYKSFYLLDRHGGRVASQPFLEGLFVGDRLAVIISANDLAGAMARDEFGQWEYDVGAGGDATRETTFRLGINLVMYALCLNYKDDAVHAESILQRRR